MQVLKEQDRQALTQRWRHFNVFSVAEWHRLLALRTAIFVVEQQCPYQEVDEKRPALLASRTPARPATHRHIARRSPRRELCGVRCRESGYRSGVSRTGAGTGLDGECGEVLRRAMA